jgi:hypothetical protein
LRGQIALDLRARSSVNSAGALVTTFATIPDAPVTKFVLTITGGPRGLLVITGRGLNVCKAPQVATARFGAQSGKTEGLSPRLATPACHPHRSHKKHATRRPSRSGGRERAADAAAWRRPAG